MTKVSPRGDACTCHMLAFACDKCASACESDLWVKHPLRTLGYTICYMLYVIYFYNLKIYSMWDYLCLFSVTSDVAERETSNRVVKLRSSDFTYSQGYIAYLIRHRFDLK